ncbi:MAG: substrate-binding domain-containing protein, partial [Woeseiaceae bacterium]
RDRRIRRMTEYNDTAAMAFISAFRSAGVRVPGDVAVVGYNDIPTAAYFVPRLTTIRQDIYQAGRVLVAKLARILDGEPADSALIRTELIERDT